MKIARYFLLILPVILIFSCLNQSAVTSEIEPNNELNKNAEDSSWTYNEFDNGELSIDITNHHLTNFSIQIARKQDTLILDLNKLSIPWKTPEVSWVNDEMICITNWWSGPFNRCIFVRLNEQLNDYIYIDKDIEIADRSTNVIVFVDTLIDKDKLLLTAENLITRKKKSFEIMVPSDVDDYPFYDSLSLKKSILRVWMNGTARNFDVRGIY